MTECEAKELSLEEWSYLAENPDIRRKHDLPDSLYEKICGLEKQCALCQVFVDVHCFEGCPLGMETNHSCAGGLYDKWYNGQSSEIRRNAALGILAMIEKWEPKNENN